MPLEAAVAENVVEVCDLDRLAAIQDPSTGVVRWRRRLDDPLLAEAAALLEETELDLHSLGPVAALPSQLAALLPGQPGLRADLQALGETYARLAGGGRFRLRLRRVEGDACRRWHVDNVALRLICTYVGRGTELLTGPEAAPARRGGQPASTRRAFALGAGEVALFRGAQVGGVVHRSPPIAGTGEARLVLIIDEGLQRA